MGSALNMRRSNLIADSGIIKFLSHCCYSSASATVAAANDVAMDVAVADAVNVVVHHLSCRTPCFSIDFVHTCCYFSRWF